MTRVMREVGPGAMGLAAVAVALAAVVVAAAPAAAQVPTLNRVDSLVNAGAYGTARADLDRWWSARDEFVVPGSDMARGLMLRARLAPDPDAAESDYLAVVLGYPASDHAPEALLRLGQGLLATGDATRSAAYLARLVADYPGRPQRLAGLLWLARAHDAARRPGPACTAAREGLRDARDPDLVAMLRAEVEGSCSGDAVAGEPATAPGDAAGIARGPVTGSPRGGDAGSARAGVGDWSVQSGAFRYSEGAERLMERLQQAGFSPRLIRVPRSGLLRVRVGRFTSSEEAASLVTRLRDRGFDAVVVGDAALERDP